MSRPLPMLASAYWLGALIADVEPAPEPIQLLALVASALAMAVCAIERDHGRAAGAALVAAALGLGAAAGLGERRAYESNPLRRLALDESRSGPLPVWGIAVADGRTVAGEARFLLDVEGVGLGPKPQAVAGRLAMRVTAPPGFAVAAGQRVHAWTSLNVVSNAGQPGAFDAVGGHRRDGIHAWGRVKSIRLLERAPSPGGLRAVLAAVRADVRRRIERHVEPGAATALTLAMVLGERATLDEAVEEAFRRAGTYHVLALSGAQIAVVAAVIVWVAGQARLGPAAQLALAGPAIALYGLLVGGDVPVMRAALAAVIALLGRALDQRSDGLHLLAVAALAWLSWAPAQAGDLGCQLSFLATAGLILLTRPLAARMPWRGSRLGLALAASFAAQWALLPLTLASFHRLAVLAPLLNLAAVPLATALLFLGVATWACDLALPAVAPLVGWVTGGCAELLRRSAQLAPVALDPRFAAPVAWACALHFFGLGVVALGPRRERAGLRLLTLAAAGLLFVQGTRPIGLLRVTVFDVGHGDALLVELPEGRSWMVDAGGWGRDGGDDRGFGERVLGPALWARGVSRVHGLVLTHAHPDHIGGAAFLVRAFGVEEVVEGPLPRAEAARLAVTLAGTERRTVFAGARVAWTGLEVEVLGPARPRRSPWRVRNDDSVVLRLRYGRHCVLLTGDAEAAAEARLRAGRCDVLKVAHHGSRTSSREPFLADVRPALALISAGRPDLFGHPHPDVRARLRDGGAMVLTTPAHGALEIDTDGSILRVRTALPP